MNKTMKYLGILLLICLLSMPVLSISAASGDMAPAADSYILGDADGDGEVTVLDVTLAQRVIARMVTDDDGSYTLRGDVDGDGSLSSIDVTLLMRYNAKLKTSYAIGDPVILPTQAPTEPETQAPPKPTAKSDPYELPPI